MEAEGREGGVNFGNGVVIRALDPFCLATRSDFSFSCHTTGSEQSFPVQLRLSLFCGN